MYSHFQVKYRGIFLDGAKSLMLFDSAETYVEGLNDSYFLQMKSVRDVHGLGICDIDLEYNEILLSFYVTDDK